MLFSSAFAQYAEQRICVWPGVCLVKAILASLLVDNGVQ